jgi:hypothetical protein
MNIQKLNKEVRMQNLEEEYPTRNKPVRMTPVGR